MKISTKHRVSADMLGIAIIGLMLVIQSLVLIFLW